MSNYQNIAASIKHQLNTRFVGQQLYYFPSLSSTMETANTMAKEGATEGTVVIANEQTSGKGRSGNVWISPRGNLAISIIFKPQLNILPQLIMVASLAVVQTIRKATGIEAQIKWPNDVLIKGKKVCGILIENELKNNRVNFAVIGIGINVNLDPSVFPEISAIATDLSHEAGKEISETDLTAVLLSELEQLYLEAQAGTPVHKQWQERLETLGKWIHVRSGKSIEEGKAETATEHGNLILRHADGSLTEIVAGEVTVIKD